MRKDVITVTTSAGGAATVYSNIQTGAILTLIYTKVDFTNGVDFTITTDITARTVWTQSNVDAAAWVNPRDIIHSAAGAAQVLGSAGWAPIYLVKERLKIVIAAGGAAKTGTFTLVVDDG